jgi:hypothetical protein
MKQAEKVSTNVVCQKTDGNCFLGQQRVLMVDLMQQGATITSEVYCETLRKVRRTIQNERHGLLTSGLVLLHDNALLNTAARTSALLEHFNWSCLTTLLTGLIAFRVATTCLLLPI